MVERLYYRITEISELIGCSRSKAYQLVAEGTIQSCRIGTLLRVHRSALEAFVKDAAGDVASTEDAPGKGR